MTKHEIETVRWWLETRKSMPTETVDEQYIRTNKIQLRIFTTMDINRYTEYVRQNSMNDKAYKYLGFLTTLHEWLLSI
jgi:hypothetical protein